jgi:hypothetical protein
VFYIFLGVYLYRPYFADFERFDILLPVNLAAASAGCYVLSRRWIFSFYCSLLAGAIYGFSPMLLGIGAFHPMAGVIAAALPWMFCVPGYINRITVYRWLQAPLSVVPFLVIFAYFKLAAEFSLFPAPLCLEPKAETLASLLVPAGMSIRSPLLFSVYHIPIAGVLTGLWIAFETRRVGILLIILSGLFLGFSGNLTIVSPVVWLMIPLLCLSIIAGEGLSVFLNSSRADFEWLAASGGVLAVCSAVVFMLSIKYYKFFAGLGKSAGDILAGEARLFLLGAVCIGLTAIISRLDLRLKPVRIILIIIPCLIDIVLTCTVITDNIL